MKNYKVTITGTSGKISYEVNKTLRGAEGFAKKVANEAFFGEQVSVEILEIK